MFICTRTLEIVTTLGNSFPVKFIVFLRGEDIIVRLFHVISSHILCYSLRARVTSQRNIVLYSVRNLLYLRLLKKKYRCLI